MDYQQISTSLRAAIAKIASLNLEDKFTARAALAAALREAGFSYPEDAAAEVVPLSEPLDLLKTQEIADVIAKGAEDISQRFGDLLVRKMQEI
jgi:hypothetical protein